MLKYKRYPQLQNICIYRLTRKSHICLFLLVDHGNAFGLIPVIIVWKDDHFIRCSFYGAQQTEDLENRICKANDRQL